MQTSEFVNEDNNDDKNSTVPNDITIEDPAPRSIKDIKMELQSLFSQIFTKENLKSDPYLVPSMSSVCLVPFDIVLKYPKVQEITSDIAIIRQALTESSSVIVTENGVRPNIKVEQNTIILRDIPSHTAIEDVQKMFSPSSTEANGSGESGLQSDRVGSGPSIRSDMNNIWFVTFSSEEEARAALEEIRKLSFNGKRIKAALKSESLSKAFYSGSNYKQRHRSESEDRGTMTVESDFYPQAYPMSMPMNMNMSMQMGAPVSGMYYNPPYGMPVPGPMPYVHGMPPMMMGYGPQDMNMKGWSGPGHMQGPAMSSSQGHGHAQNVAVGLVPNQGTTLGVETQTQTQTQTQQSGYNNNSSNNTSVINNNNSNNNNVNSNPNNNNSQSGGTRYSGGGGHRGNYRNQQNQLDMGQTAMPPPMMWMPGMGMGHGPYMGPMGMMYPNGMMGIGMNVGIAPDGDPLVSIDPIMPMPLPMPPMRYHNGHNSHHRYPNQNNFSGMHHRNGGRRDHRGDGEVYGAGSGSVSVGGSTDEATPTNSAMTSTDELDRAPDASSTAGIFPRRRQGSGQGQGSSHSPGNYPQRRRFHDDTTAVDAPHTGAGQKSESSTKSTSTNPKPPASEIDTGKEERDVDKDKEGGKDKRKPRENRDREKKEDRGHGDRENRANEGRDRTERGRGGGGGRGAGGDKDRRGRGEDRRKPGSSSAAASAPRVVEADFNMEADFPSLAEKEKDPAQLAVPQKTSSVSVSGYAAALLRGSAPASDTPVKHEKDKTADDKKQQKHATQTNIRHQESEVDSKAALSGVPIPVDATFSATNTIISHTASDDSVAALAESIVNGVMDDHASMALSLAFGSIKATEEESLKAHEIVMCTLPQESMIVSLGVGVTNDQLHENVERTTLIDDLPNTLDLSSSSLLKTLPGVDAAVTDSLSAAYYNHAGMSQGAVDTVTDATTISHTCERDKATSASAGDNAAAGVTSDGAEGKPAASAPPPVPTAAPSEAVQSQSHRGVGGGRQGDGRASAASHKHTQVSSSTAAGKQHPPGKASEQTAAVAKVPPPVVGAWGSKRSFVDVLRTPNAP